AHGDGGEECSDKKIIRGKKGAAPAVTLELVKAEKRAVPAALLEIPAGYKKQEGMLSMMPGMMPISPEQQQTINKAMDKLTPEQRKMLEGMMKKKGGQYQCTSCVQGGYDETEPVTVEVLGRSYARSALVMGHTVLLGAMVLEGLDLAVDPVRQRLMPNLGTWEQPLFRS